MEAQFDPPLAHAPARVVAGAFAYERDAIAAAGLIAHAGIRARYVLRPRTTESGDIDLVVLETTLRRAADRDRVETLVEGAHGAVIDPATPVACGLPRV